MAFQRFTINTKYAAVALKGKFRKFLPNNLHKLFSERKPRWIQTFKRSNAKHLGASPIHPRKADLEG